MHKLVVLMLLAVVTRTAAAEWLWLGVRDSTTTYFDLSTITRANDMAKVWVLVDYQTPPAQDFTKPYKSHKQQLEFDCAQRKMRSLALAFFADNMGEGEAVYTEDVVGAWAGHPRGGIEGFLMKIACGKE